MFVIRWLWIPRWKSLENVSVREGPSDPSVSERVSERASERAEPKLQLYSTERDLSECETGCVVCESVVGNPDDAPTSPAFTFQQHVGSSAPRGHVTNAARTPTPEVTNAAKTPLRGCCRVCHFVVQRVGVLAAFVTSSASCSSARRPRASPEAGPLASRGSRSALELVGENECPSAVRPLRVGSRWRK